MKKIWIMVLDSIYWECTGGHESTKVNYQLFRKFSVSVIVILGNRMRWWQIFPMIFVCNMWDSHCLMCAVKNRSCQRLEVKSNFHHSRLTKIIFNLRVESKLCNVLAIEKWVHFHYNTFSWKLFDLFSKQNHWLNNWFFHWREVIWWDFESRCS